MHIAYVLAKRYVYVMRLLITCLILLVVPTAYAVDESGSNIFKANLSDSDLSLAISSFENVCLPFVFHKTEMTSRLDRTHYRKLLKQSDLNFQSSKMEYKRYLVERGAYKIPSQSITSGTQTVVKQTGELNFRDYYIPAKYKTLTREIETYNLGSDKRLKANIRWSYPSQRNPGKSCEIRLEQSTIDKEGFIKNFIEQDKDWVQKKDEWSQCIKEDDGEFLFVVKHQPKSLSLYLTRDDMFETDLCSKSL